MNSTQRVKDYLLSAGRTDLAEILSATMAARDMRESELRAELAAATQRAEDAERALREAREQEPVEWVVCEPAKGQRVLCVFDAMSAAEWEAKGYVVHPRYADPVPPPPAAGKAVPDDVVRDAARYRHIADDIDYAVLRSHDIHADMPRAKGWHHYEGDALGLAIDADIAAAQSDGEGKV